MIKKCRFDSYQPHAAIAQLVEFPPCKRGVGGSNPSRGALINSTKWCIIQCHF